MTEESAISEVPKKVIILTQRYVPIRVQKKNPKLKEDLYICANKQLYHYYSKGKKTKLQGAPFFLKKSSLIS